MEKLKIRTNNFVILLIIFILMRPTFAFFSATLGRLSDLVALILSILAISIMRKRIDTKLIKNIQFISYIFLLYLLIMNLSYFVNNYFLVLSFGDLSEYARPFIWFCAFMVGYIFVINDYTFIKAIKTLSIIGFIHALIGVVEFILPHYGAIFYKIFSTSNLFYQHRAGGIVYTHTEYTVFSVTCALLSFYMYSITKKKYHVFFGLFTFITSILSFSKAGFIFFALVGASSFIYMLNYQKKSYKILLLFVLAPIIVYIAFLLYEYSSMLNAGYEALINYQTTSNLSISNRVDDIQGVFNVISNGDYRIFIGSTPYHINNKLSYIEISFFNIFFRFGIFGVVLYYLIIFIPFIIKKNKTDILESHIIFLLRLIAISLFIVDFTANVSETIKFSFLLFLLYGMTYRLAINKRSQVAQNTHANK